MYWAKRGTGAGANKLLVYYQGGGACWDQVTCAQPTGAFDDDVLPSDNPANTTTGLGDLTNPNNPFADWNAVFVSYCTGDVHWGDNKITYVGGPPFGNVTIQHRGYINAKVVEKWAREHFVAPDEVFVTGSSAGAYGAVLHGILLHEVFPTATFNVVGDAGNGVITQSFLVNNLDYSWHVEQNLPTYIPQLDTDITQLTIADLYIAGATYYESRGSRFGQYTTSWDGGPGSQIFFYNVMVNGIGDNANWWHSACPWNAQMRQYATDAQTGAPNDYRYYIGPGSRHTIYGSNRVYTETHGGVQTFVSWLNDMRLSPTWNNADCTPNDCSLLGACDGASPVPGASCQHNAECSPGVCTPIDVRPTPGQNPPIRSSRTASSAVLRDLTIARCFKAARDLASRAAFLRGSDAAFARDADDDRRTLRIDVFHPRRLEPDGARRHQQSPSLPPQDPRALPHLERRVVAKRGGPQHGSGHTAPTCQRRLGRRRRAPRRDPAQRRATHQRQRRLGRARRATEMRVDGTRRVTPGERRRVRGLCRMHQVAGGERPAPTCGGQRSTRAARGSRRGRAR